MKTNIVVHVSKCILPILQCNTLAEIAQAMGENDVKRFFEEYPSLMRVSI